jgi:hypothetical protein
MLDSGVDGVARGRKPGGVMLQPETVVADLTGPADRRMRSSGPATTRVST